MTDQKWRSSTDLWRMLNAARYVVSRRKILLFAAAAIRTLTTSFLSRPAATRCDELANSLESYAKGEGLYAGLQEAVRGLGRPRKDAEAVAMCRAFVDESQYFPMFDPTEVVSWPESRPEWCDLLREVVGRPFKPARVEISWLNWNRGTVAALARSIRAEKKFELMPLLGDALEDAGCTDPVVLSHCRGAGPHVVGCWVIDLLVEDVTPRRSLEETWRLLEADRVRMPRTPDGKPFVPPRMPSYDDDPLGFSYFKTRLEKVDLGNLTLPRTFFGRFTVERVEFCNTDLSQSRMCWNDFIDCDFSRADLRRCDMRASTFARCRFVGADLRGADLRRSAFDGCDFTGANLKGAKADEFAAEEWELLDRLSESQQKSMKWSDDPGPEPDGG